MDAETRAAAARRRLLLLAALAVVAVAVVVLVVVAVLGGGEEPAPGSAPTSPTPSTSSAPGPSPTTPAGEAPAGGWVPPERQVTLPAGTRQIDEYPVGFPAGPQGAAAAEVTKNRYTTLDYEQANQVARIYLAPALADLAAQGSTAQVERLRDKVGAPRAGPAPTDRFVVVRPVGVQWEELADGRVRVQVVGTAEYRTPERSWTELVGAGTVWERITEPGRGEDWRAVEGFEPSAGLAQIGTAEFNDEGWSAIVTETAR